MSDDPYLTGAYAVEFLRGMQEGEEPGFYKMTAGVKHYAGYSMETNRFTSTGNFSMFDLWDSYLVPYEAAFTAGGAAGSMCSYISLSIDGGPMVPACANTYLLSTVVRQYWGAPGAYHTSDCGAVQYMKNKGFTKNDTFSAAAALNGGMDLNSNTILPSQLALALQLNLTTEATLDASLARTLAWRFRLGQLDPLEAQPLYMAKGLNVLGTSANQAVALEGSAQGLVLAKNAGGALPLTRGLKLAVLGPQGMAQEALLGDYYADSVCPGSNGYANTVGWGCVPTLAAALTQANVGGTTTVVQGVTIKANDTTWGAALAAAAAADAVVLALGTDRSCAEEGGDLLRISLPGAQSAFALAVLAAAGAGKPVVLLLVSSFALSLEELYGGMPAVVLAYNPGFGAARVAEALFGANRWGRSVFTHYPSAYVGAVALNDFSMVPGPSSPGRSCACGSEFRMALRFGLLSPSPPLFVPIPPHSDRYYNGGAGPATIKFGQGLSYNTLAVACTGAGAGSGTLTVNCTVASTAGPAGEQVLQLFHRAGPGVVARVAGAHPIPLSSARDVQRFALGAGATAPVSFALPEGYALSLVNATGARNVYAGAHFIDVWDGGANNITLTFTADEDAVVSVPPLP